MSPMRISSLVLDCIGIPLYESYTILTIFLGYTVHYHRRTRELGYHALKQLQVVW